MLQLMQIGNKDNNMFAVVDEKSFMENMRIQGIVRIEKDEREDVVINYTEQSTSWFAEVYQLRQKKRLEIYSEDMLIAILIQLLIEVNKLWGNGEEVKGRSIWEVLRYIKFELHEQGKLKSYSIDFEPTEEYLFEVFYKNSKIFWTTKNYRNKLFTKWDYYSFRENVNIQEFKAKYPLDNTLAKIIHEYVLAKSM